MGIFSDIFRSILGGVANSGDSSTEEGARESGRQARLTNQFSAETDYYYNQLLRHEKAKALSSGYNQFSTVRQFAPGYTPATGLDALPPKPLAGDFNGKK